MRRGARVLRWPEGVRQCGRVGWAERRRKRFESNLGETRRGWKELLSGETCQFPLRSLTKRAAVYVCTYKDIVVKKM